MRKTSRPIHLALTLLTAVSLSFGAAAAFAAPGSASDNPTIIGTCTSQQDCQSKCELAGGFAGECDIKGRCHCAY